MNTNEVSFKFFSILLAATVFIACRQANNSKIDIENISNSPANANTEYVFETTNLKRYQFPTHSNDLIIDRSKSSVSEVFMVIVEAGKTVIHHKHDDTEQVFYMLKGQGNLLIGEEKTPHSIKPGDVIRIPFSTWHSVETINNDTVQYICVDCFGGKPLENTWDEHVKVVCDNNNWDYNAVIASKK